MLRTLGSKLRTSRPIANRLTLRSNHVRGLQTAVSSQVDIQRIIDATQVVEPVLTFSSRQEEIVHYTSGLLTNWPQDLAVQYLDFLYINANLPWCGTIALSAVLIRFLLIPPTIAQMKTQAKIQLIAPQMKVLQVAFEECKKNNDDDGARQQSFLMRKLMVDSGANPMKIISGPLMALPIFMSMFFGIQKIILLLPSMKVGGMLWFTDLTVADPTYQLSFISAALMLTSVEIAAMNYKNSQGMPSNMKNIMRALCVVAVPFTAHFPAALLCYWISNNTLSIVQNSVFKFTPAKEMLGIPEVKVDFQNSPSIF